MFSESLAKGPAEDDRRGDGGDDDDGVGAIGKCLPVQFAQKIGPAENGDVCACQDRDEINPGPHSEQIADHAANDGAGHPEWKPDKHKQSDDTVECHPDDGESRGKPRFKIRAITQEHPCPQESCHRQANDQEKYRICQVIIVKARGKNAGPQKNHGDPQQDRPQGFGCLGRTFMQIARAFDGQPYGAVLKKQQQEQNPSEQPVRVQQGQQRPLIYSVGGKRYPLKNVGKSSFVEV